MRKKLIPLALAAAFAIPAAHASVDLVAVGSLSGLYQDLATETAAPLENGVAGNLLGGMGSGLAYAGGDTFLAVPDRGPNAVSYNSAIDDTASYINRFQTLKLLFAPSPSGSALPLTASVFLTHTTLLWSAAPLTYGSGAGLGVGGGAPALNGPRQFYFTGRSDNYDPKRLSNYLYDGRLDPESIRVSNDGQHVFISDEYGPFIYQFSRVYGSRQKVFTLPAKFAVKNLSPVGATEISGNTSGRVANKGMEGLAISPDGSTLFGAMQSPLIQDGGTDGPVTRIVKVDVATGATTEYGYQFDNIGTVAKPKYGTISDIVAVNDHEFLVDERDGKGLGDNSTAVQKKVYHIDISGAQDISAISGAANLAGTAVAKDLFVDLVAVFNAHGIASTDIPAKLEGLALGPDVTVNGATKHTLVVSNDNDFIGTVTDSNHPSGIDNSNKFFVLGFDAADLPNLVPQPVVDLPNSKICH